MRRSVWVLLFGVSLLFGQDTLYVVSDSVMATWLPSIESKVVGYRLYVNGAGESNSYLASTSVLRVRGLRVGLHRISVSAYSVYAESELSLPVWVRRLPFFLHPADITSDGVVDVADSLSFRKSFKRYSTSKYYRVRADYDRSGYVSEYDRGYFEALWQNRKQLGAL